MNVIQSRMNDLLFDNACPFTQAAFVDVQATFFYAAIQKQRFLFGMFCINSVLFSFTKMLKFQGPYGPVTKI